MKNTSEAQIIVGNEQSEHMINPYLFGHFIEDIDDHMPAMLAFPLRNMDFEQEDHNADGVSGCWYPLNFGKHTRYALEPAARWHSGHSQKIRLFNKDRCDAGIGQKIEVKASTTYQLRMIARATREISKLLIKLIDQNNGELLGFEEFEIRSHQWKEFKGTLQASRSCAKAELQVWAIPLPATEWEDSVSTGMVWFDHISMLPQAETGMLKQEVFEMAQALNGGIMRLGGNFINLYHWEEFVGPTELRPNYVNEAWEDAGHVHKYFGTDEFIALCRQLGVEPQICVNMGTGTAEEAARWVEYCNGDMNTAMGALRAANGHPEPYAVKYWEIGNEMYGPWQAGVCDPEQYAALFLEYAAKMKSKDSSIRLLGCGTARDSLAPGWNRKVLEHAGHAMDFITLHLYQGRNFFPVDSDTDGTERFKMIMAFPEIAKYTFGEVEKLLHSRDDLRHVKIAVTEWNTMYFPNPDLPNTHTLEAAIANACVLNEMMRQSYLVQIANFSDLVNGWVGGCIRVGDSYERMKKAGWSGQGETVFGTATYHMLKMYANRSSHRILKAQTVCETFDAGSSVLPLNLSELKKLDVVCTTSKETNVLNMFIVNRSFDLIALTCDLSQWRLVGEVLVRELAHSNYEARNTVFEPNVLHEEIHRMRLSSTTLELDIKPHSVCIMEVLIMPLLAHSTK